MLALEQDLQWLQDGSKQTAGASRPHALAAAKKLVGPETLAAYMKHNPRNSPSHAFHRICTDKTSSWRQRYNQHMDTLAPLFAEVTSGDVRICPIIDEQDTALILRTLWHEYRMVERRYFSIHQKRLPEKRAVDILIAHLLESVHTMIGLIQFLPNFVV